MGPSLATHFMKQGNYRIWNVPSIMLDFLPPSSAIPEVFHDTDMTGVFIVIDIEKPCRGAVESPSGNRNALRM